MSLPPSLPFPSSVFSVDLIFEDSCYGETVYERMMDIHQTEKTEEKHKKDVKVLERETFNLMNKVYWEEEMSGDDLNTDSGSFLDGRENLEPVEETICCTNNHHHHDGLLKVYPKELSDDQSSPHPKKKKKKVTRKAKSKKKSTKKKQKKQPKKKKKSRSGRRKSSSKGQPNCCIIGCNNFVTNRLRFSLRCHTTADFKPEHLEKGWNKVCHYHYFSDLYKWKKSTRQSKKKYNN